MNQSESFCVFVLREYEKKLKELMGDGYIEFAEEVSKKGFKKEIEGMAESEFKDFILDNFDDITRLQ